MSTPALATTDDNSTHDRTAGALQHEIAQLEKLRHDISSEMEALRNQERQLRACESRAREARPQPGPVAAGAAPLSLEELQAGWDKFHRAHALLEAERRALTDERLELRARTADLEQRENELKRRETWLAQREAALTTPPVPVTPAKSASASGLRLGLNELPFADLFRTHKKSA